MVYVQTGVMERKAITIKVKRITEVLTHKQSVIFTDGSVYGGIVGCGACAAVHSINGSDDDFSVMVKEVGLVIMLVARNVKLRVLFWVLRLLFGLLLKVIDKVIMYVHIFCLIVKRP